MELTRPGAAAKSILPTMIESNLQQVAYSGMGAADGGVSELNVAPPSEAFSESQHPSTSPAELTNLNILLGFNTQLLLRYAYANESETGGGS